MHLGIVLIILVRLSKTSFCRGKILQIEFSRRTNKWCHYFLTDLKQRHIIFSLRWKDTTIIVVDNWVKIDSFILGWLWDHQEKIGA